MEMKGIHWTVSGTLAVAGIEHQEGAEKGEKVNGGWVGCATAYTSARADRIAAESTRVSRTDN